MGTPPSDPADLAAWLDGHWAVRRTINGDMPSRGAAGCFTGTAQFTVTADGEVAWDEHGQVTLGAHTGPARRTLFMRRAHDRWQVSFDDGRPFHDLDLRDGTWAAQHRCGADVYDGIFSRDDEDPGRFTVIWHVTGPGRDDTIVSDYRRR